MPQVILTSYVDRDSYFHKVNPLTKIVIITCVVVLAFALKNFVYNLILISLIIPIALESKVLSLVFKPIRYLYIIFVILFVIQGFFYPFAVEPLVRLPFGFTLWADGLLYAANVSARLLSMMVFGYWFVLTTHPGDLVSALQKIGLPHEVGYVLLTTLQIIPRVRSQMAIIIDAQKSRGLETKGSIVNKFKAYVPLLGPLFMGSVQQTVERSMALEARAFSSEGEKTSYRLTVMRLRDKIIMAVSVMVSIIGGTLSCVL